MIPWNFAEFGIGQWFLLLSNLNPGMQSFAEKIGYFSDQHNYTATQKYCHN